MLALLGSLLGLMGALAPRLIGLVEARQHHRSEVELLKLQSDMQIRMMELGHAQKLAEIGTRADAASELAAFQSALRPSGIALIDGFNGFVRPFLTLCFFALYAAVKAGQVLAVQETGFVDGIAALWGEEDWAIWAAIVTFWFGNRTFNRERGR